MEGQDGLDPRPKLTTIGERTLWLRPVALVTSRHCSERELNRILELTREHQARLLEVWNDYFGRTGG